jgi:hypothetical protein
MRSLADACSGVAAVSCAEAQFDGADIASAVPAVSKIVPIVRNHFTPSIRNLLGFK